MGVYIVRRLLWLPFLLFAVSLITYTLVRVGPGDPVEVMLGPRYDPDSVVTRNLRHDLGLDKTFIIAYGDYMWGAMRGDFGESFRFRGRSVGSLIRAKIWVSVQVNLAAVIVSLGIGLPLGFWVAHKQGTWMDPSTVATTIFLMSIPVMVTLPAVLWFGCRGLGWVPCSGWGGFFDPRIVTPAIALGIPGIAIFVRLMRASTLDVLGQDFIRTARSKGLSEFTVDYVHVLKNAMIPIVTILSFVFAGLLTTSFIVERILGIPGIGQLFLDAVFQRDYPIIMAMTLVLSTAFVIALLLADIAYRVIDPRIRYE